jgi:hypothetical protein
MFLYIHIEYKTFVMPFTVNKTLPVFFLTVVAINYLSCNHNRASQLSEGSAIPSSMNADSTLTILNSLSADSLFTILQLPPDLVDYDSFDNVELQIKIYATSTGECEKVVLVSFDLIVPDTENIHTVFFLIKSIGNEWKVTSPLIFESAGGVDYNYALQLEDDTTLNASCSTIRIVEYYEDEEVSYQRHTFYTINQAGEFIKILMYTPNYQLSSNEEDSSGKKQHTTTTETLHIFPGLHDQFKDIKLSVAKQEGSVTTNLQIKYQYNIKTLTYTEIKN